MIDKDRLTPGVQKQYEDIAAYDPAAAKRYLDVVLNYKPKDIPSCTNCGGSNVKIQNRKNYSHKYARQRFWCHDCKRVYQSDFYPMEE